MKVFPQAALMFVNGFAILNNERFLEKCVWLPTHPQLLISETYTTSAVAGEIKQCAVLCADGWGFSQMGVGDGTGTGHSALKSQIVGFLFAAAYMRGWHQLQPSISHQLQQFRMRNAFPPIS